MLMASFLSGIFTAGLAAFRGGSDAMQTSTSTKAEQTGEQAAILNSNEGDILRKCWRLEQAGRISELCRVEEPLPAPGAGEVRVKVKAIGLNMADIFAILDISYPIAEGLYGATPQGSFIPGLEYSGVVDALGPPDTTSSPFHSSTIKAGDPVYGFTRFGAYASHLNVPLAYVRPLPSSFSFAQGAAFIVQGLTAWHAMIELGNLKKGQTVLVHSAAGGVGCFALEICAKFQAFPIATIGSETKRAFLQSRFGLNDGQIVVREKEDRKFARQLKDAVRGRSGRNRVGERARGSHEMQEKEDGGFDLILDALGGMYFKEGYKQLARGGRMITFGAADYLSPTDGPNWWKIIPRYLTRPRLDPGDMCAENRGVLGFNLIWLTDKVKELNAELDDMLKFDWNPPHVGATYPFHELPDAVRALQSGLTTGKVVVLLSDEECEGQTALKA